MEIAWKYNKQDVPELLVETIAVEYDRWRNELFGHPPDSDPFSLERPDEFHDVTSAQAFDFIDRILSDGDVHQLFTKEQLGNGIKTIYDHCCGDFPYLYTTEGDEDRRVTGISNLVNLYPTFRSSRRLKNNYGSGSSRR